MRRLRRLIARRRERWDEGAFVIEGPDLVEAALDSGAEVEAIYVEATRVDQGDVGRLLARARGAQVRVVALAPGVLQRVADAKTPQPLLASVRFARDDLGDLARLGTPGLVLVLDNVRDPGNAGTIIRSADAAGAVAVVLSGDSVDPYNPKTLRASAGSIFHVPVVVAPLEATLAHFGDRGVRRYATVVRGGTPYHEADLAGACVVVIGNESAGLDEDAVSLCDASLSIPMAGRSESLNCGVAASLIAFEALDQRRATTSP
ncbi:MAG: RNA methyltransferase [Acidobacteriota bacterium]|nr:RNA methyltransferase [Acidobacteriota bacterium]